MWLGLAAMGVVGGWSLMLLVGDGSEGTTSREADVVDGVCAALDASDAGGDARAIFYDRAHDGLHELARETAPQDRVVAGRLLRAKERVEALLDRAPAAQTTAALQQLSQVAADAAVVIDPDSSVKCE